MPLRVIYRRALRAGEVTATPLEYLELPAVRGTRERIAAPQEAAALLAAVPDRDRAIWATALYAGLRLGELKALRCNSRSPAALTARERAPDRRDRLRGQRSRMPQRLLRSQKTKRAPAGLGRWPTGAEDRSR
jgi:integrase